MKNVEKTISEPLEMPTTCQRYRFNVEQYETMAEAGILRPSERVELIEGEILVMSPIGSRHHGCVIDLQYLLITQVGPRGLISVQGPLRLNAESEPEPDLAVLKPRADSYRKAHAGPLDVIFLVEVMNTSADRDRTQKLGLYARSEIPEVWLVDLNRDIIEVHRRPVGGSYTEIKDAGRGATLSPLAFPDVVLGVDAILG